MRRLVQGLTILLTLGCVGTAMAQDTGFGVDEVRGVLYFHGFDKGDNAWLPWIDSQIQDANVELLFTPFDLGSFNSWGELRPHVGATVNFAGLESMVYGGLSFTSHLFDTPLFIEGTFGGAVHNGASSGAVAPARNLGCPVLFHESVSVGYDVTPDLSVMITADHISNAGLCDFNRGLSKIGVRVGWKF